MAKLMGRLAALGAARKYASKHSDQVHGGIDKVAGMVRGRAGGHADKVDKAASLLKKAATGTTDSARSHDEEQRGSTGDRQREQSPRGQSPRGQSPRGQSPKGQSPKAKAAAKRR